jgi:hypothetical protein
MAGFYKVTSGSIPQSTDVNQYADAFAGNNDISGGLTLASVVNAPSTAPTATLASGTGLGNGAYMYKITYCTGYVQSNGTVMVGGETTASNNSTSVTASSPNNKINLTISTASSTPTCVARRIYRTKVVPSSAPTLASSGTGNTLTAGTYFVKYTWVYTGGGESTTSPESSKAVTSGQLLTVTIPSLPAGVASANIYVSTATGTETLQRNITSTSTNFTAPISAGASAPTTNNFYLLTTINDNVTTSYADTTPDTSLTTTQPPTVNSTGTGFTNPQAYTGGSIYSIWHGGNYTARSFAKYKQTAQYVITSSGIYIVFLPTTVQSDYLNEFNSVGGVFTAQSSGVYYIGYTLRFLNLAASTILTTGVVYDAAGTPSTITLGQYQAVSAGATMTISASMIQFIPAGVQLYAQFQTNNTNSSTLTLDTTSFIYVTRTA